MLRPIKPYLLALFAVALFSATAPATKYANTVFDGGFIAASRALLAGLLALVVIKLNRWPKPALTEWVWLAIAGAAVVIAFPFLLSYTMAVMTAAEMGIVLAALPITTAVFSSYINREAYSAYFWLAALTGTVLLIFYVANDIGDRFYSWTGILQLGALITSAGIGYASGSKAAQSLGGWQTICWCLALYLPLSTLMMALNIDNTLNAGTELLDFNQWQVLSSSLALLYLIVVSQWWGFKFWYQAMADIGTGRIAQIQLLQPFLTLSIAALLLSEDISATQMYCALAVTVIVIITQKAR